METIELSQEEMILGFLAEGGNEFVSGAALSDKLGLTGAEVWKHVEQLRRLGYRIDALPARGYRLLEVPDRLTALELGPLLATRELGRTLHHFDTIGSTNATAWALAQEGAFNGEVVIAEQQTEGRGRRGRTWSSPPGTNLYFSAVVRPDMPVLRAPEATLVTAVALCETLREAGVDATIKWPNDIHIGGKKVAGILTELCAQADRVDFLIVGVGVNLNVNPADLPPDVAAQATSVMAVRGQRVPRALFAAALWVRLESWFDRWAEEGFAPVREAWKRHSAMLGQEVLVRSEGGGEQRGVAEDIDESGALLLRVGDAVERVLAGEVEQVRTKKA